MKNVYLVFIFLALILSPFSAQSQENDSSSLKGETISCSNAAIENSADILKVSKTILSKMTLGKVTRVKYVFKDSVINICLYNGECIETITMSSIRCDSQLFQNIIVDTLFSDSLFANKQLKDSLYKYLKEGVDFEIVKTSFGNMLQKLNSTSKNCCDSTLIRSYYYKNRVHSVWLKNYGSNCRNDTLIIEAEDEKPIAITIKNMDGNEEAAHFVANFTAAAPTPVSNTGSLSAYPDLVSLDFGVMYDLQSSAGLSLLQIPSFSLNGQINFFNDESNYNWGFNYINARVMFRLLSANPLSLDPLNVSYVSEIVNEKESLLSPIEEFELPDVTEIINLSEINAFFGLNILTFGPKSRSRGMGFHVFVDMGVMYLKTPVNLISTEPLIQTISTKIDGLIEGLKAEAENATGQQQREIQDKLDLLFNLANDVLDISKNIVGQSGIETATGTAFKQLDRVTGFTAGKGIWYYGPSINAAYVVNPGLHFQGFIQMLYPLSNITTSQSILDNNNIDIPIISEFLNESELIELLSEVGLNEATDDLVQEHKYKQQFCQFGAQASMGVTDKLDVKVGLSYVFSNNNPSAASLSNISAGLFLNFMEDRGRRQANREIAKGL
jgi:hypothetical protein